MKNEDKLIPLYYKAEDGDYKLLGKVSEITSDITDVVEPTVEYEEFIKKFKRNQDLSISFSVSNVNKDVLIKEFIEPYIQYEYQRKLKLDQCVMLLIILITSIKQRSYLASGLRIIK